ELATSALSSIQPQLAKVTKERFGWQDAMSTDSMLEAWRLVGAAALAAGDENKAERYLDAAWRLGVVAEAAWALGELREKQGRLEEAVQLWEAARMVGPLADVRRARSSRERIEKARAQLSGSRAPLRATMAELREIPVRVG